MGWYMPYNGCANPLIMTYISGPSWCLLSCYIFTFNLMLFIFLLGDKTLKCVMLIKALPA